MKVLEISKESMAIVNEEKSIMQTITTTQDKREQQTQKTTLALDEEGIKKQDT